MIDENKSKRKFSICSVIIVDIAKYERNYIRNRTFVFIFGVKVSQLGVV